MLDKLLFGKNVTSYMIIFINGSFGVGKSTVAEKLVEQLPNSLLFDPEMVGYFLGPIVRPITEFEDFQDLPMWRPLVVETARQLKQAYGRTLIMPQTIWFRPYFEEIMEGLRQFEPDLFHFCLTARPETIYKRLRERGHTPEANPWVYQRVEPCVTTFQAPDFAVQISNEDRSPDEVVSEILSRVGAIQTDQMVNGLKGYC